MTTSHENPFGTGYGHTSPAARNMMKLGLSGPIFQPPPGDTYLFRTASLEKEWQDAFRQATDTPSAKTPDNPPASVPSGWARQSAPASGTPSSLLPNTFNSVSESGLRFPVINEKALENLGKILLPDPARDPASRPLPPAFPADTRKTAAVPETSPAKTGFIPAGKPRQIPMPGDPDYNPDNPLCEPMAVRPIEQGKNAPYFHELTSDQQTWLFSRFYQSGAFTRQERTEEARKKAELARGENFRRYPDFFRAAMKNDWDTATQQMEQYIEKLRENRATKWQGNRLQKEVKWYKKNR